MGRDQRYDQYKKNKSAKLKGVRHFLEWLLLWKLQIWVNLFGVRRNQAFGRGLGDLAYRLAKKDVGIARFQLEFCLPEKSQEEREEIIRLSLENVGMTLFETLAMEKIRKDRERWISLKNPEVVHRALEAQKGAIFVFGHIANWELIPIVYEMLGIQGFAIESPIGEEKLDKFLGAKRNSPNIEMIPRGDKRSAKAMLGAFRNNRVMLFALDQDMKVQSHFVDFFGKPAATAKGAANLAQKFEAPVISIFGTRLEDGSHEYAFELLSEAPYHGGVEEEIKLTQRYTHAIESHVREHLTEWVWFHRRWKTRPDEIEAGEPHEEDEAEQEMTRPEGVGQEVSQEESQDKANQPERESQDA